MTKKYQVVGIGNAMVDVLCHTEDAFLAENGVEKGIMQLIDMTRARELYGRMGPSIEVSGGSAANTIAGIAALGGRTAYVGKVKDDQLGAIFAHDLRAQGAVYETPLAPADHPNGHETGRCMVLVTPDGERSMNTYLGMSEYLAPGDIDTAQVAEAEWLYLEGYRFDGPDSHEAFAKAIRAAKDAGGKVSLTLSDPFCIERHRDAFRRMIVEDLDLLFCNRAEMLSMYRTESLDAALDAARREVAIVVCTDSENGAHVIRGDDYWHAEAVPTRIVDATGAGDLFASGFLWGLAEGRDLLTCGRMGCVAASEVIGHLGARPEADLKALYREHGLA
jgi:fructokinase